MGLMNWTVDVGSSKITCIPSVHHVFWFADLVRATLIEDNFDAVAVELGPGITRSTIEVFRDLKQQKGSRHHLPMTLGILSKSRLIRPDLAERARVFTKIFGESLDAMSSKTLNYHFDYAGNKLLQLQPTDSIVEAMRYCEEADIPSYGVDLEECAYPFFERNLAYPDPYMGIDAPETYINTTLDMLACFGAGETINQRREFAMAARLKGLCGRHENILFVCGLAHWGSIRNLLQSTDLKPAPLDDRHFYPDFISFEKCIVAPHVAFQSTALYPFVTERWEQQRVPVHSGNLVKPFLSSEQLDSEIQAWWMSFLEKYLDLGASDINPGIKANDAAKIGTLLPLISRAMSLKGRKLISATELLGLSSQMMSPDFIHHLTKHILDVDWIDPSTSDYSTYPANDAQVFQPRFADETVGQYENSAVTFSEEAPKVEGYTFTWRPDEARLSAGAAKACRIAMGALPETASLPFNGRLYRGIDLQKTLRHWVGGNQDIFVKKNQNQLGNLRKSLMGFPVVWIFSDQKDIPIRSHRLFQFLSWLAPHAQKPDQMREQIAKKGAELQSILGFTKQKKNLGDRVSREQYYGFVNYHPMHFSIRGLAAWLEKTRFERIPILKRGGNIIERIAANLINPEEANWRDLLVACGLAYAKEAMTVVYPRSSYRIPRVLRYHAERKNVTILEAFTDQFEPKEITAISRCHLAPAVATHPKTQYAKYVEELIGESQNYGEDLIPTAWRDLGLY